MYVYIIKTKKPGIFIFPGRKFFFSLDQYGVTRNCKLSLLCLSDNRSTTAVITVILLRQLYFAHDMCITGQILLIDKRKVVTAAS